MIMYRVIASLTKEGEAIFDYITEYPYLLCGLKDCFVSAGWRILAMTVECIGFGIKKKGFSFWLNP